MRTAASRLTIDQQKALLTSLNQATACWLLGTPQRTFRDQESPRNDDGTYDARDLIAWDLSRCDGDSMATDTDSPGLERYRQARARLAEMDLAERRERLIDMVELSEWWHREIRDPVTEAADELRRRHGDEAAELILQAVAKSSARLDAREAMLDAEGAPTTEGTA